MQITGASRVSIINCHFQHLGGSGLWIGGDSADCKVIKCHFEDISANGVNFGELGSHKVPKNLRLEDSTVQNCGKQYFGSVGVWIGMSLDCRVTGCEISNLPYTGLSVGWRWSPTPSPCKGHQISHNHIHHVLQILSDGGGIYTLGLQPGTALARNYIHDIPLNAGRAQSNGIFMDQGSTDITVEGNLIDDIAKSPIRFHQAGKNLIKGNWLGIKVGETAFTYNRTNPKVLDFEGNQEFQAKGKEIQEKAKIWLEGTGY